MNRFIVISGISGGGKSSIIDELSKIGHKVISEPGREIVKKALKSKGDVLPWVNPIKFAEELIKQNLDNYINAKGLTFFDRSIIDAISYYRKLTKDQFAYDQLVKQYEYHYDVFFTPPWPEIYKTDAERQHDYTEAKEEYDRLKKFYPECGYNLILLPKLSIEERVNFILDKII